MLHVMLLLPLLGLAAAAEHDASLPSWRVFEDAPPADMAAIAAVERAVLEV